MWRKTILIKFNSTTINVISKVLAPSMCMYEFIFPFFFTLFHYVFWGSGFFLGGAYFHISKGATCVHTVCLFDIVEQFRNEICFNMLRWQHL